MNLECQTLDQCSLLEPPEQLRSRGEPPAAAQPGSEQPAHEEVRSA